MVTRATRNFAQKIRDASGKPAGEGSPRGSNALVGEAYSYLGGGLGPLSPYDAGAGVWPLIHELGSSFSDGDPVGVVPDAMTTNASYLLTQATGAMQPLYRRAGKNGKSYLEFDGIDDQMNQLMNLNYTNIGDPYLLMMVVEARNVPVATEVLWCGNFGPKIIQFDTLGRLLVSPYTTYRRQAIIGRPFLLTVQCFGDSTGVFRVNGEIDGTFMPACGMDLNVQNIGAYNVGTSPMHLNLYATAFWGGVGKSHYVPQPKVYAVERFFLDMYGI